MLAQDEFITLRITKEEKGWFLDYCQENTINRSALIRKLLKEYREKIEEKEVEA
jgi:hypothetical protein